MSYAVVDVVANETFAVQGKQFVLLFQVFNLLNSANYGLPVDNARSPLFGETTTVTLARQGEFDVWFQF